MDWRLGRLACVIVLTTLATMRRRASSNAVRQLLAVAPTITVPWDSR